MSAKPVTPLSSDLLFSRERLAGYDPEVLGKTAVLLVGAGAAGNNIVLNLALLGVGEIRIADDDTIDPSNYARSPGFAMVDAPVGARKAQVLARAAARIHPRPDASVRYACSRVEGLGLGALSGATVVVSAVDSKAARAYLADATRFLGIPMVEVGFRYPHAHVAVFSNAGDDAPCWRCREPEVTTDRVSCSLYARRVALAGGTPATQPLAAVVGAFAADACARLAHHDASLLDTFTEIDLRGFRAERMGLATAATCGGIHRRATDPLSVDVDHNATVEKLFEAVKDSVARPTLVLPTSFLVSAPCAACGRRVGVGLPSSAVKSAPRCAACEGDSDVPAPFHELSEISTQDSHRNLSLRRLGFRPGDIVRVAGEADDSLHAYRLLGSIDALFHKAKVRALVAHDGTASEAVTGEATGAIKAE